MVNSLVLVCGTVWFLWKFFSGRNLRHLFVAIFAASFILPQWPLFLPYKLSFAIAAFTAAGFLFYEYPYQKGVKNSPPMTYIYILLFVVFGILFFGEAWLALKKPHVF